MDLIKASLMREASAPAEGSYASPKSSGMIRGEDLALRLTALMRMALRLYFGIEFLPGVEILWRVPLMKNPSGPQSRLSATLR
jgi:hypothetical protein